MSFLQGYLHFCFLCSARCQWGSHARFWKCTNRFLDALASLDLKLSVSEWVIYRFQLAHIRVFQSYLVLKLKLNPYKSFFLITHMLYGSTSRTWFYMYFLFFSSPSLCNFWTNGIMSALLLAISMLAPGSLGKRPFLRWLMLNIETPHVFLRNCERRSWDQKILPMVH